MSFDIANWAINNNKQLEWSKKIPSLKFKPHWGVTIIPPFMGALIRFWVKNRKRNVSVYLDVDSNLGYFGGPYWEVYNPNFKEGLDGDGIKRFAFNQSAKMMKHIEKVLDGNNNNK